MVHLLKPVAQNIFGDFVADYFQAWYFILYSFPERTLGLGGSVQMK